MDTLEAVARGVGGLLAVLAVVWTIMRVLRSRLGRDADAGLRVSQRVGLGRRSGVAVVEAGTRRFLVGVGESQVSLLAELRETSPAPEPPADERPSSPSVTVRQVPGPRSGRDVTLARQPTRSLGGLVERARERTLRR